MNKRQKKKEYKKLKGENPPKWMNYHGKEYRNAMQKLWEGEKALLHLEDLMREAKRQKETIRNLEEFNRAMTERRKKCRKRNW